MIIVVMCLLICADIHKLCGTKDLTSLACMQQGDVIMRCCERNDVVVRLNQWPLDHINTELAAALANMHDAHGAQVYPMLLITLPVRSTAG